MRSVAAESDGLTLFYLNGEIAVSPSKQAAGWADRNGKHCIVETNTLDAVASRQATTAHEIGHVLGALHPEEESSGPHKIMRTPAVPGPGSFQIQRRFTIGDHVNFTTAPELELITP